MKTVPLINLFLRQTRLFSLCTYYIISAKTNQEICRIISDFKISVISSHTRSCFFYLKHILPGTRHSKKTNRTSFCTLFLKLPLQFFLFRRNTNFSTAPFSKRETKTVWSFFLRNYLCRVPGKISLIIVFPQFPLSRLFSDFHKLSQFSTKRKND